MFEVIEKFAAKSVTLKEARENVENISLAKEIGIYIVLFLILYFFMILVVAIAGYCLGNIDNFLISLFSFAVVPIGIYIYATKIEKRSWRSIGFSKGNAFSSTLKGALIGFSMFLAVVIIGLALGQFTFSGFDFSQAIYALPFLVAFTIQSFGEEIYTRGWTLTYFSKRHSILSAILAANIIFIIPHCFNLGFDLLSIINIFLVGTVFAVMFLRFDNIWICGGAHTAWNFSQGIIFGFSVSGAPTPSLLKFSQAGQNIIAGGIFGPESGLIATGVIVVSLIIMMYYKI